MGNENGPRSMLGRALQRFFDMENPQYLFLFIGLLVLAGLGYGLFKPDGTFLGHLEKYSFRKFRA